MCVACVQHVLGVEALRCSVVHPTHQRQVAVAYRLLPALCSRPCMSSCLHHTPPYTTTHRNLDQINATIETLRFDAGFPVDALHTVAIKANPVGKVLKLFLERGMGAEVRCDETDAGGWAPRWPPTTRPCRQPPAHLKPPVHPSTQPNLNQAKAASLGELAQALAVGFPRDRIVFDSPAKTRTELAFALQQGVAVNLDNFQELERAVEILAAHPQWLKRDGGQLVGLRINPQVGFGYLGGWVVGWLGCEGCKGRVELHAAASNALAAAPSTTHHTRLVPAPLQRCQQEARSPSLASPCQSAGSSWWTRLCATPGSTCCTCTWDHRCVVRADGAGLSERVRCMRVSVWPYGVLLHTPLRPAQSLTSP